MVYEIRWIQLSVAGQYRLRSAVQMSHQAMSKRNNAMGREINDPVTIFTICVKQFQPNLQTPEVPEFSSGVTSKIQLREKLRVYSPRSQLYTTSPVCNYQTRNKTKLKHLCSKYTLRVQELIFKSLASVKLVQNVDHPDSWVNKALSTIKDLQS